MSASFALAVLYALSALPGTLAIRFLRGGEPETGLRVTLESSALTLEPSGPATTEVSYRIELTVFGKLASLGLAVIKGRAKQMADEFAARIRTRLETPA